MRTYRQSACFVASVVMLGCGCFNPASPDTAAGTQVSGSPDPGGPSGSSGSVRVVTVRVDGKNLLSVGETTPLTATAIYSDASTKNVTGESSWRSDKGTICSVNSAGQLRALASGQCTITAEYQQTTGQLPVTVTTSTAELTLVSLALEGETTLAVGETKQWQAIATFNEGSRVTVTGAAQWQSQNTSVATVNGGLVSGVAAGSAVIQASYNGQSASNTATVTGGNNPAKQLIGIELTAESDLSKVSLGQLLRLHVFGVYNNGSKDDVTSVAVLTTDDPLLRVDGPGLVNVLLTMKSALQDPNHLINAQYGGFTASASITIQLPVLQSLQLDNGLSLKAGSQLPAVQAFFSQGASATLEATYAGVAWSLQPRGSLGTVLQTMGVSLSQILNVNNGSLAVVNSSLLNQALLLAGGALPVNLRATFQGVQSNQSASTVVP